MARQKGIFPIEGTIGNVTFFKTANGYLARAKGGVDGSKIATSPAFQRTRENNAEFGRAGKAGKVLREALRALFLKAPDGSVTARLTTEMLKVIKLDSTSTRGLRNVLDGELELLGGFECNMQSKLAASIMAPYSTAINRVTGICAVSIPPFIPSQMIAVPGGATHFKLTAGAASIDFEQNTFSSDSDASGDLVINDQLTTALILSITLPANSTHPIFVALALEFLQDVNGTKYNLKNGSYNAMAIVKVEGV